MAFSGDTAQTVRATDHRQMEKRHESTRDIWAVILDVKMDGDDATRGRREACTTR